MTSFRLFGVFRDTVLVLRRCWSVFVPIAAALSTPVLIFDLVQGPSEALGVVSGDTSAGWVVFGVVLGLLQVSLAYAVIVDGTVRWLDDGPWTPRAALADGLRAMLPVAAISVVVLVVQGLGLLLLIVPGLIIGILWIAVSQVYVVERPPIADAFRRSLALTQGARWRLLPLAILFIAVQIAIVMVDGDIKSMAMTHLEEDAGRGVFWFLILDWSIEVVAQVVIAVLAATTYTRLRDAEADGGREIVSTVFS